MATPPPPTPETTRIPSPSGSPVRLSPSPEPAAAAAADEDDDNDNQPGAEASMPLPLTQSLLLTNLPKDASAALANAGQLPQPTVKVRLQPIGSAPAPRQRVYKIGSGRPFSVVVGSLRKQLKLERGEGVFCYVNSVFAPGLDEVVGNLWRCFKTGDELVVAYAKMPAFG